MSTQLLTPCQNVSSRAGLERTRFYARQLVAPEDLTQDQIYFREKARRHNRMLHGWGIVCGACVRRGRGACEVIVEPGYILGPWGDEIVIPQEVKVDICKLGSREQLGCCDPSPLDPWCGEARADCPAGTLYLAIRYEECDVRPVRVPHSACGCGCDDAACENSRIRDGYAIAILRELPPTYATPMRQPTLAEIIPCARQRTAKPCPPCPESPWVILADLAVDAECRVRAVDCFAHRRHVVSWAEFYFTCLPQGGQAAVTPPAASPGIARTVAAVTGSNALIDMDAPATDTPRATVAMVRPDGEAATIPAFFAVRPGESMADLLEREGDRRFYDPVNDETISLRELFAGAAVAGETSVENTAGALAPLEGRTLDVGGTRDRRSALRELLADAGLERLERQLGGVTARAPELPATTLVGVAPLSALGGFVAEMSIADVAIQPRDRFVAAAVEAAPVAEKRRVRKHATEVWIAARRVRELSRGS